MIAIEKKRLRTAEYHDRARDASALAEASVLDHVRKKHEIAAARWSELALINEADLSSSVGSRAAHKEPSLEALISEEASCAV